MRSSRTVTLIVVGSVLVLILLYATCDDQYRRTGSGGYYGHRHSFWRPWGWGWGSSRSSPYGYGGGYSAGRTSTPATSSGSHSTSSTTSRGGFGSTGHSSGGGHAAS